MPAVQSGWMHGDEATGSATRSEPNPKASAGIKRTMDDVELTRTTLLTDKDFDPRKYPDPLKPRRNNNVTQNVGAATTTTTTTTTIEMEKGWLDKIRKARRDVIHKY